MHIILCIRAREKTKQEYVNGKLCYIPLGVEPVTEKNVMFEMTASVMMEEQGKRQIVLKCPAELQGILGRGNNYITAEDGKALRAWIDGASPADNALEKLRARLEAKASHGRAALEAEWQTLTGKEKAAVKPFMQQIKAAAAAFDEQAAIEENPGDTSDMTAAVAAAIEPGNPLTD